MSKLLDYAFRGALLFGLIVTTAGLWTIIGLLKLRRFLLGDRR